LPANVAKKPLPGEGLKDSNFIRNHPLA